MANEMHVVDKSGKTFDDLIAAFGGGGPGAPTLVDVVASIDLVTTILNAVLNTQLLNGADVVEGTLSNAAVTDPTASIATVTSLLRGFLDRQNIPLDVVNAWLNVNLATGLNSTDDIVTADQGAPGTEPWLMRGLPSDSFTRGRKVVGTSAVSLSAFSLPLNGGVTVVAGNANTGTIYIADDNAVTADTDDTTTGIPLLAGDSFQIAISDLSNVWAIADAAGQKLYFIGA